LSCDTTFIRTEDIGKIHYLCSAANIKFGTTKERKKIPQIRVERFLNGRLLF